MPRALGGSQQGCVARRSEQSPLRAEEQPRSTRPASASRPEQVAEPEHPLSSPPRAQRHPEKNDFPRTQAFCEEVPTGQAGGQVPCRDEPASLAGDLKTNRPLFVQR